MDTFKTLFYGSLLLMAIGIVLKATFTLSWWVIVGCAAPFILLCAYAAIMLVLAIRAINRF